MRGLCLYRKGPDDNGAIRFAVVGVSFHSGEVCVECGGSLKRPLAAETLETGGIAGVGEDPNNGGRSGRRSFAGNSLYNFITQLIIFLLALVSVPFIVSGLGTERFGLLSILWLFVGYFSFLDLGIGQATVKYFSERIARHEKHEAAALAWTSLKLSALFGLISAVLLILLSFVGIHTVINVSPELRGEAAFSLQILALCLPAIMVQGVLRSISLSFNRFDLVNIVQTIGGALQWLGSTAVVLLGGGFIGVICLTVITRYITAGLSLHFALRLLPELRDRTAQQGRQQARDLLLYGGWMTVAQILGPVMFFMERMFIGRLNSLEWVAYYSVPSDALMKLVVIPMSFATTLFPYLSRIWIHEGERGEGKKKYLLSVKYIFLILAPLLAIAGVFSHEILTVWLGSVFADQGAFIMVILSIGILVHSLSQMPNAAVLALGRPDMAAKLLIIELPLYLPLCYLITGSYGIHGTIIAWLGRMIVEATTLFIVVYRIMSSVSLQFSHAYLWKGLLLIIVLGTAIFLPVKISVTTELIHVTAALIFLILYAVGVWKLLLADDDRLLLLRMKSWLNG